MFICCMDDHCGSFCIDFDSLCFIVQLYDAGSYLRGLRYSDASRHSGTSKTIRASLHRQDITCCCQTVIKVKCLAEWRGYCVNSMKSRYSRWFTILHDARWLCCFITPYNTNISRLHNLLYNKSVLNNENIWVIRKTPPKNATRYLHLLRMIFRKIWSFEIAGVNYYLYRTK